MIIWWKCFIAICRVPRFILINTFFLSRSLSSLSLYLSDIIISCNKKCLEKRSKLLKCDFLLTQRNWELWVSRRRTFSHRQRVKTPRQRPMTTVSRGLRVVDGGLWKYPRADWFRIVVLRHLFIYFVKKMLNK